jgi:hypothetical protein
MSDPIINVVQTEYLAYGIERHTDLKRSYYNFKTKKWQSEFSISCEVDRNVAEQTIEQLRKQAKGGAE